MNPLYSLPKLIIDHSIAMSWMALILLSISAAGCSSESADHEHIVYHHRPSDYTAAVQRLREIHTVLLAADQAIPDARVIEFECNHDHGHGTVDQSAGESVEDHHHFHSVSIDIFTELFDVARWLPAIAAESYLPKEPWDQINQLAGQFNQLIEPVKNKTMMTDRRAAYQDIASQTEPLLAGLEEMFDVYENASSPF